MKKKSIALILCGVMIFSVIGCGSTVEQQEESSANVSKDVASEVIESSNSEDDVVEEKIYDEHIDITYTGFHSLYQAAAGHDIEADPLVAWVEDKFNVTIDQWECASTNAEAETRLWVSGGSMPDSMIWNKITTSELKEYADQELIQPLPVGWEEKWPNIAKMVEISGYGEMVKFDGLTYAIPHALLGSFFEMDDICLQGSVYYRKDWAEQVGMPDLGDDFTIKMSELREYLEKVKEAGLCDNPTLSATAVTIGDLFRLANGICGEDFIATNEGYIWEPQQEGYADYLKIIQEWYKAGLIDPDFYVKEQTVVQTEFQEGLTPAMYYTASVGDIQTLITGRMSAAGEDIADEKLRASYLDIYGVASVEAEDGTLYANGRYNYWMMNSFSPECDEKTMERILDMVDWFCTPEGQACERCGIPGQDFVIDENKVVTILNQDIISGKYQVSPSRYFNVWGYAGDDLAYAKGIPGRYAAEQQVAIDNAIVKSNGTIFKKDDKLEALATESKKNYSINIDSKIAEIITSMNDVDAELASYIESNRNIWEPVVDDLNK